MSKKSKKKQRLSFEEDIDFIEQLIDSLEESLPKLEKAYSKKDSEKFSQVKMFMKDIQKQISGVLK
jgi:exonuclease VII small subunit|tara:strand:- start:960 stop:1157 length:198 start_codon:yes stop_codon:yes gene_type:complete